MRVRKLLPGALNPGTLYHIELADREEIEKFLDWMEGNTAFPFSIYMQGVTYTFTDSSMRDMFVVAFHAAQEAYDNAGDDNFLELLDGEQSV